MFAQAIMVAMTPIRVAFLALVVLFTADILPALASTSVADAEPYELNANRTQVGRYSYTALILTGTSICTGTLVTPHTIITAAHCFNRDTDNGSATIFDGNALAAAFGTDIGIAMDTRFFVTNRTSVAVHPSYNATTSQRDIAVMRIDLTQFNGPPLSFDVNPIGRYARAPVTPAYYNASVISIGWGTVDVAADIGTNFLRDVQLTIQDPNNPACKGRGDDILFDRTAYCTVGAFPTAEENQTLPDPVFPNNRKDECNGDSGGPIIIPGSSAAQDLLIAETTAGLLPNPPRPYFKCGDPLLGGTVTSIGSNIEFIDSMINEYEGTGLPRVNITNVTVSQDIWEGFSLGSAHLDFLVNMTITTDYLMRPIGEFTGIPTPLWPELAIKAVHKRRNTTTILPFEVVAFDTPSFTYTLLAFNYQVVSSITFDIIRGHLDIGTGLEVLFKARNQNSFGPVVATLSEAQLLRALCSANSDHVALRVACSNVRA